MNNSSSIYGKLNYQEHWYALVTRSRHEKRVDLMLKEKGIQSYLPLYWSTRVWSDRIKRVELPLFSCYIFVCIALENRFGVLQTPGVVRFVSFNDIPCPIPDNQINCIRGLLSQEMSFSCEGCLKMGEEVEVIGGPLKGCRGIYQHRRGESRFYILIEVINQSIGVEIPSRHLRAIQSKDHLTRRSTRRPNAWR